LALADAQRQEEVQWRQYSQMYNISKEQFTYNQNIQLKSLQAQQDTYNKQITASKDKAFAASVISLYNDMPEDEKIMVSGLDGEQLKDYLSYRSKLIEASKIKATPQMMKDGTLAFFDEEGTLVSTYNPRNS